jgi:N-acyl homoserine lactone hydrolase
VSLLVRGGATRASVVLAQHGSDIALFDTGLAHHATSLLAALADAGVTPEAVTYVFNTHAHPDHSHNNALFPHARLVGSARDRAWTRAVHLALARTSRPVADDVAAFYPEMASGAHNPRLVAKVLGIDKLLWDETRLGDDRALEAIEDRALPGGIVAIETPGHSPHHLSFLVETSERPVVICGDALLTREEDHLANPVMPPWSLDWYRQSRARLAALDAIIVPGHDLPFENHVGVHQKRMSKPPAK